MATWKGNNISVSLFGTSHAQKVGVEICGLPKESFNEQTLYDFLKRRSPSNASFSTKRIEADTPTFLEGVENESVFADKVVADRYYTTVGHHAIDVEHYRLDIGNYLFEISLLCHIFSLILLYKSSSSGFDASIAR